MFSLSPTSPNALELIEDFEKAERALNHANGQVPPTPTHNLALEHSLLRVASAEALSMRLAQTVEFAKIQEERGLDPEHQVARPRF